MPAGTEFLGSSDAGAGLQSALAFAAWCGAAAAAATAGALLARTVTASRPPPPPSARSGSDAASLKTTARRDGDSYVLNGAKAFIRRGGRVTEPAEPSC